jgi:adenylate kinase family enzyme
MSESAYTQKKRKLEREEKIVSSKDILLDDNIMFTIYGDKISLIDFNKETAIVIESPEMARFQEKIFRLLYKKI